MLGYMEQSTVYNAINFSFAPAQALNLAYYTNSTILYTRLDLFICPSDGVSPTTVASARLDFNCNYVGSTGTTIEAVGSTLQSVSIQPTTGIFGFDNPAVHGVPVYGMASVTDGSSNTIAYSEHLVGGDTAAITDVRRASFGGVTQVAGVVSLDPRGLYPQVVQALAACSAYAQANAGTTTSAVGDTDGGCTWLDGYMGSTLFNTITPPNNPQYAWGSCQGDPLDAVGARGVCQCDQQPLGGANYGFVDGSVRFLKSSISLQTYWSLGTRAGGEVISSDSY